MSQPSNSAQTLTQPNPLPSIDIGPLFDFDGESMEEEFLHSSFFSALHPTIPLYDTVSCQQDDSPDLAMNPLSQEVMCVQSFSEGRNGSASNSKNMLPQASLDFHKGYIKNRIEKSMPDHVPSKQLFEEIKAKGYQGAFNTLRVFLTSVRPSMPKEASLHFHRNYLKKREKEMHGRVLPKQLFEEIKERGYQGTLSTIKVFLAAIRRKKKVVKQGSLGWYKNYLEKRLKESPSTQVSAKHLFEEITAMGYRGAFKAMQAFLTAIRDKPDVPPEASFRFHRDYLKKRLQEARPNYIFPKQLFGEITARGYRGSIHTIRMFLSTIRAKGEGQPQASLDFHKDYIKNRLEKGAPGSASSNQLFEEIKAEGYRGSASTLRKFLSTIREKEKPEESLDFHKEYIKNRLEKSAPKCVSSKQLFEEITARGYRGALNTLQKFLASMRGKKQPEALLDFHKEYIKNRLETSAPDYVSLKQLFEEIIVRGYRGSASTLQKFLSDIREKKQPEALLGFHKDYIKNRLEMSMPKCVSSKQLFEEITDRGYRGSLSMLQKFLSTIREKGKN